MAGIDGEPVGDVEQRVGCAASSPALLEPERRACEAALPERGSGRAERARDDEAGRPAGLPSRPGTRFERPSAVTLSSTRSARVVSPPDDRDSRLVQALVQRQHVVELGVRRAARA